MPNAVTAIPAASSSAAKDHFAALFTFETDCWDIREAMREENAGSFCLTSAAPACSQKGHIPGRDQSAALGKIIASKNGQLA